MAKFFALICVSILAIIVGQVQSVDDKLLASLEKLSAFVIMVFSRSSEKAINVYDDLERDEHRVLTDVYDNFLFAYLYVRTENGLDSVDRHFGERKHEIEQLADKVTVEMLHSGENRILKRYADTIHAFRLVCEFMAKTTRDDEYKREFERLSSQREWNVDYYYRGVYDFLYKGLELLSTYGMPSIHEFYIRQVFPFGDELIEMPEWLKRLDRAITIRHSYKPNHHKHA